LELHKFVVDVAFSGEEALKKVLKQSYSLIILDVQMPDMDGFEVAEAISGYSKSKDIPIIFLSAVNKEKKYITKGYESGGVDYVTKPFDPDLLLLKVKSFYKMSEQNRQLIAMDKFLREEIEFRKKAESELQERVEELKSILESMPQMAFTTKLDGDIEFVNNHWFMYSDDVKSFPVTEGLSVADCVKMAIQTRRQIIQEVKIKLRNTDDYRFHLLYLTPVRKDDHLIKWVGIFTDIHEQRMASQILETKVENRTQALRQANKKLEESNNELQQFAFVASHDLQEPLRKIQVFTNIVMEKYPPHMAEGKRLLEKVVMAADRMRKLITDLLDYSRPPGRDLFRETDLNALVAEVLVDLELKVKAKNAVVQVDPMPTAVVIPGQIKQVFQNLISNALKFSKENVQPQICITCTYIDQKDLNAPDADDGDYCRLTISDNGIGFQQRYADKVFEIFQRLNQKESYEGTGIGLSIVKKTIERHHGLISVQSKENVGTKFTIVLPLRRAPGPADSRQTIKLKNHN